MYNVLVVGCGYAGSEIARLYVKEKQRVYGIIRRSERANELLEQGIQPVVCDLRKPETLKEIPPAHFIVLSPAPYEHDTQDYRDIYLNGIKNFFDAIRSNPRPIVVIYLSSTGVYSDREGDWVDERTLLKDASKKGQIMIEAERQVLASGYPAMIFRLAGIYGPARNRLEALRKGAIGFERLHHYVNLIHVEDIARGVFHLFKKGEPGEVYLGCDDCPVLRKDYFEWLLSAVGKPQTLSVTEKVAGKRCNNKKIKSLGFSFKYPDFRAGHQAILDREKGKL